jgi:hypothetical protein
MEFYGRKRTIDQGIHQAGRSSVKMKVVQLIVPRAAVIILHFIYTSFSSEVSYCIPVPLFPPRARQQVDDVRRPDR